MPTYDYECTKCRHAFEHFQGMKQRPLKKCPKCGGLLRRLVSGGSGLIFKGSGFYITDYKKKGSGSGGATPSSESSSSTKEKKAGR